MRKFIVFLTILFSSLPLSAIVYVGKCTHEDGYGKEYHDCCYDNPATYPVQTIYLYGKVKVVTKRIQADLAVYVTDSEYQYDMCVKWVEKGADECGLWQRVESGEDFSIIFVKSCEDADLIIRYEDPRGHYNYNGIFYYPFLKFGE